MLGVWLIAFIRFRLIVVLFARSFHCGPFQFCSESPFEYKIVQKLNRTTGTFSPSTNSSVRWLQFVESK